MRDNPKSRDSGGERDAFRDPYLDALRMLGRRELSEAQVRQRLARRGHEEHAVEEALTRLRREGALDDRRAAEAVARRESSRGHGRLRAGWRLEQAGIDPAIASRALDDAFAGADEDERIRESIARRVHGRMHALDDREFQRIYRALVAQGFDPDRVLRALKARSIE